MDVRKFTAKDAKTVIQKVRDCFGDSAIILSNKRINDHVEIIAARESSQRKVKKTITPKINPSIIAKPVVETLSVAPEVIVSQTSKPDTSKFDEKLDSMFLQMHSDIKSFKELLNSQLLESKFKNNPIKGAIYRYGTSLSLSSSVIEKIYQQLNKSGLTKNVREVDLLSIYKEFLMILQNQIQVSPNSILQKSKITALIGPNGVGKTSMLAKIAAHYILNEQQNDLIIVTSDTQKVAGAAAITKLAKILNLKTYKAASKKELFEIFALNQDKMILLDTPGFSLNESLNSKKGESFQEFSLKMGLNDPIVSNYLVMPVIYQNKVYENIIQKFNILDLQGVLLTMFDSITDLGIIISDLIEHDLKIAYYSDGNKIPQSLHRCSSKHLIETLLFLTNSSYNEVEN